MPLSDRVRKATAVVLRDTPDGPEVLVFDHPLDEGGVMLQLPAGTVESGEEPEAAAIRELFEETGVRASTPVLAAVQEEELEGVSRIRWVFLFQAPTDLPDEWASTCDCGAPLRCHWLPLNRAVIVGPQQPWLESAKDFLASRRPGPN
jgi:8-oxo-dGTP pyrophosphatase MutT (NUDIX family)